MKKKHFYHALVAGLVSINSFIGVAQTASVPSFSHIVVVIGENTNASSVFGSTNAPYINALAAEGAKFTNSFALFHPSQPNYIALYSGGNQGVSNGSKPSNKFTTANLGRELIDAGKTYKTYSEGLPSVGFDGSSSGDYVRKHNPAANWMGTGTNQLPATTNQPFTAFPSNFNNLPSVSFVIPDMCNDGHDNCPPLNNSTLQYDKWIETNLGAYKNWCINNNSLLIVTYDEDDFTTVNKIATVFYGANVAKGDYSQTINHYSVLRTIEDAFGLTTHAGAAATASPINFCWKPLTNNDKQTPTAPSALVASATNASSTNLTWNASSDNVGVSAYQVYKNNSLLATVNTTSYTVSGLMANTAYSFFIKAIDAAGNVSVASNTATISTLIGTISYCNSNGKNAAEEYIGNVSLNTINNTSASSGYSDFTAITSSLTKGNSYSISISPVWPGSKWAEGYAVFIDYNGNGTFADAGETVWTKAPSTLNPVSGSFTVPATAKTGTTRMRVILQYNAIPAACGTINYGETEDYTINITGTATAKTSGIQKVETIEEKQISLFPNPAIDNFLNVEGADASSAYEIFNSMGQAVGSGKVVNNRIYIENLLNGIYFVKFMLNNKIVTKNFIKQ